MIFVMIEALFTKSGSCCFSGSNMYSVFVLTSVYYLDWMEWKETVFQISSPPSISFRNFCHYKKAVLQWTRNWACYEIKKSVGRTFDTSKCCRKWFSINYTKRKLRNCEWHLKLLREKNRHLLGKLIFENWPKCASLGFTRYIWGNQNISFILIFYRN